MDDDKKWLGSIDVVHKEMGRLIDYFGSSKPPMVHFTPGTWEPGIDIYETDSTVVVLVELAGVVPRDINIAVDGNSLVVRGERQVHHSRNARAYHQIEILTGSFERGVLLPVAVDTAKRDISCNDGMLEIVLYKSGKAVHRHRAS